MSINQCVTLSDITDLRTLVSGLKNNLYTWINNKKVDDGLADAEVLGVQAVVPMMLSLGSYSYSQPNTDTITGDSDAITDAVNLINEIQANHS